MKLCPWRFSCIQARNVVRETRLHSDPEQAYELKTPTSAGLITILKCTCLSSLSSHIFSLNDKNRLPHSSFLNFLQTQGTLWVSQPVLHLYLQIYVATWSQLILHSWIMEPFLPYLFQVLFSTYWLQSEAESCHLVLKKISTTLYFGKKGRRRKGKGKVSCNYHVSNKQGIKWGPERLMFGSNSILPQMSTWDLLNKRITLLGPLFPPQCHFSYPHRVSKLWPPPGLMMAKPLTQPLSP